MSMENQEVWILEERELAVLLSAKGISHFHGFHLQGVPENDQDTWQVLLTMVRKEMLLSDGRTFQVARGIAECIKALEKARGMFLVLPSQTELPQSFCYPGEKLLVLQPVPLREGTLRMWLMDWKEIREFLQDNGRIVRLEYYAKSCTSAEKILTITWEDTEAYVQAGELENAVEPEQITDIVRIWAEDDKI